ncbi:hypothetical protein DEJ46_00505 [Streptomyces venezuelae]|uniref:Uncharacterized protein n=1 Tax=Streptomyces venezuelae TaxID=54571 RepID=A0A5P2AJ17_STRVZ|nr:hypothetical protein DEJ46_00505 [Streptomyces venezuelae]
MTVPLGVRTVPGAGGGAAAGQVILAQSVSFTARVLGFLQGEWPVPPLGRGRIASAVLALSRDIAVDPLHDRIHGGRDRGSGRGVGICAGCRAMMALCDLITCPMR